jgi:hypothetical protein
MSSGPGEILSSGAGNQIHTRSDRLKNTGAKKNNDLPLEPESGRAHRPEEKKTFSRKIKSDDKVAGKMKRTSRTERDQTKMLGENTIQIWRLRAVNNSDKMQNKIFNWTQVRLQSIHEGHLPLLIRN